MAVRFFGKSECLPLENLDDSFGDLRGGWVAELGRVDEERAAVPPRPPGVTELGVSDLGETRDGEREQSDDEDFLAVCFFGDKVSVPPKRLVDGLDGLRRSRNGSKLDRAAVFPRAPGVRELGTGDLGKKDGERGLSIGDCEKLGVGVAFGDRDRVPLKKSLIPSEARRYFFDNDFLFFLRRGAGFGLGVGAGSMRGRFGVGARRFDSEKGSLARGMSEMQRFGAKPTGEKK